MVNKYDLLYYFQDYSHIALFYIQII